MPRTCLGPGPAVSLDGREPGASPVPEPKIYLRQRRITLFTAAAESDLRDVLGVEAIAVSGVSVAAGGAGAAARCNGVRTLGARGWYMLNSVARGAVNLACAEAAP